MGEQEKRLERAVEWCGDNLATVRFFSVQGRRRVQIYVGDYGFISEGDTLPAAVDAAEARLRRWRGT